MQQDLNAVYVSTLAIAKVQQTLIIDSIYVDHLKFFHIATNLPQS